MNTEGKHCLQRRKGARERRRAVVTGETEGVVTVIGIVHDFLCIFSTVSIFIFEQEFF